MYFTSAQDVSHPRARLSFSAAAAMTIHLQGANNLDHPGTPLDPKPLLACTRFRVSL